LSEIETRRPKPDPLRRGCALDILLLTIACGIAFFTGLTAHGLTNWQESQRALVAREMQAAGEWLVPTINQQPYLAKPPLFYWVQLAIAKARGAATGEFELRLAVALAGLLGVLATYVVVRDICSSRDESPLMRRIAREAALWSALFLATGPLYIRSARIGELDIWLVPFVVIAVGGIARAWRAWRADGRTDYAALAVATIAGIGAALTKGPPGAAVIAVAGYGPIVMAALLHASATPPSRKRVIFERLGAFAGAAGAAWLALPQVSTFAEGIGAGILIASTALIALAAARALRINTAVRIVSALARTHPLITLGVPASALWIWGRMVGARIGAAAAAAWAQKETEDNLQIFIPISPIKNLEAAAFGVGFGSLATIIALAWLVARRPRLTPAWLIALAWVGLGLALFSLLGKGLGRYLTPLWPGVAMLGGMFVATIFAGDPPRRARHARIVLGSVVAVAVIIAGGWYGWGREHSFGDRSPRAIVAEVVASPGVKADRLASFEFRTAAIDFYAGHRVQPVGEINIRDVTAGGKPWTLEELVNDVRANGAMVVFVRDASGETDAALAPIERLRRAGLSVELVPVSSRFTIDSGRRAVVAARIR